MKKNSAIKWLPVFSLIVSMLACNMPTNPQPTVDVQATIQSGVIGSQTAAPQVPAANVPAPQDAPTATLEPQATLTSTLEPTITLTPTITITPTPEGVFLTLSQNTNCRTGPLAVFPAVTTVGIGVRVEVMGRNPENDTFYVRNPNAPNTFCWVWGQYATLEGNQAGLPVFTPQPTPTPTKTPTPTPAFTVSYIGVEYCDPEYALKFLVKNTGGLTWQSIKITLYDTLTAVTFVHTSDTFKEWSGCSAGTVQNDLTPGEQSYILNVAPGQFDYNPTGDLFNITFTLCSADGLGGSCSTQTLNITP